MNECSTGSQQRYVQSFTPLEGQQHLCEATAKSKHQTRETPRTRRKQEPLRSPGVQVKSCKLRTSSQSSKEPVAGDIEMEQVAFPKFSSATLNFHMRGKLSDMINEASKQFDPDFALRHGMFRVCRPSLVRVKQLMGSHFGGNKLMAWIVLRHLLTWPCQRATRWCVGFNFVRPRATGYQPTEFKGSLPKRCGCLGLGQRAWSSPHSNPQNAIGLRPLAIGGFGTLTPGTTSLSIISRLLSNPCSLYQQVVKTFGVGPKFEAG